MRHPNLHLAAFLAPQLQLLTSCVHMTHRDWHYCCIFLLGRDKSMLGQTHKGKLPGILISTKDKILLASREYKMTWKEGIWENVEGWFMLQCELVLSDGTGCVFVLLLFFVCNPPCFSICASWLEEKPKCFYATALKLTGASADCLTELTSALCLCY